MELEVLGWSPGLVNEDLDWLLRDTPLRAADNERRLGINALMDIWNKAGRLEPTLQQIRAIAAGDPAMHAALDLWINPPPPDPALTASEAELRRVVRRNEAKRRRIDQSWLNLIQQLRRDPEQLRHLPPATAQGVDPRLYHLWQLLSNAVVSNARYAVGTVRSIEPALGPELAAAFRDGLIRHWRTWQPVAKSTRPADSRNTINSLDAMGIAGVSMEAELGTGLGREP